MPRGSEDQSRNYNLLLKNLSYKDLLHDWSFWLLLVINLVSMFWALIAHWNLIAIMWMYWFQSVEIGMFNFFRIMDLKEFSVEGFTINDRPAQATEGTKYFTAVFFAVHYGFFHFGYAHFLLSDGFEKRFGGSPSSQEMNSIMITAGLFFIAHLFSYLYNAPKDTAKQNIGKLMGYPYTRIIPMHFTIIFGSFIGAALPLFLILKTAADCYMHLYEHNVLRKGEAIAV
jgi:hypothetical protein